MLCCVLYSGRANKLSWTEEEEMELQRVYEELKDAEPDPVSAPLARSCLLMH